MIDTVNDPLSQEQLDAVIREIDTPEARYLPEDAIQTARKHRDQVIPELIKLMQRDLEVVRRNPKEYPGNGSLFSLYLLAEFKAVEAVPVILDILALPDRASYQMFGDAITEDMARILVGMTGERCVDIGSDLFRNQKLYWTVRSVGARMVIYAAFTGTRPRAEIVTICKTLLAEAIARKDSEGITWMISDMLDLYPIEAAKEIEEAFEKDLVDEFAIDLKFTREHLIDRPLEPSRDYPVPPGIEDMIDELRTWAAFSEELDDDPEFDTAEFRKEWQAAKRQTLNEMPARPYEPPPQPHRRVEARVGRNDPCPCRSGKKFKKCCGARR